jgi:predicted metal-dependent hydrolase
VTSLAVEDLVVEVRFSRRRRTIGLVVERDGGLTVSAPEGSDVATLEAFVREKRPWLYRKLAEKKALQRPVSEKQYVSGEGFLYLGRSYRLLVVDEQDVPLKLEGGRFRLRRSDADIGRECFIRWYGSHSRPWLRRRVRAFAPRIGVAPAGVEIRDLGHRWGSCSKSGKLNFHWATVLLPASIVEYVVVHELVHLIEANHTPEFWLRVERAMPDYEQRRQWLAEHGAEYVGEW